MKKITLTLVITLILIMSVCFSAFAADDNIFTADIPDYVNYSGGAWFEVLNSSLGRCTVIFPLEFKDNIFGFSLSDGGLPTDIVNFSNSTIYGLIITANGTEYSCRCSRFSSIEYQTTTSYNTYTALNPQVVSLSNSNMLFITEDSNYINDTVPDYDKYFLAIFSLIAFCEFFTLCSNLLRRGRR